MSGGYRHATDRVDGTIIAECPNKEHPDDDHLSATVEYEDAADTEIFDEFNEAFSTCGVCGAELEVIGQQEPTEVIG